MNETSSPTHKGTDLDVASGPYRREPDAARDLRELEGMATDVAIAVAPTRRPEAVVALLRVWAARNETDAAWRLAEILVKGIQPFLRKFLAAYDWLGQDAREDLAHDLALRLYEEWFASNGQHAFWEIRFWHCLRLRIIDLLRKGRFAAADLLPGDELLGMMSVARRDPRRPTHASHQPDVERIAALAILARLDEPLRRTFVLKHYAQWTDDEIATEMGVTSRTVRNWLHRARKGLDDMLRR